MEWRKTGVKPDKIRPSAAAVRRKIEAFTIVGAWLLDTGCPDDMVSRDMAIALSHFFRKCIPREWHSANGAVTCDEVLPIAIGAIGDKNAEVHIMQDTPALLSIGKRVIHGGYSFVWLNGRRPCLVTPRNRIIPLDVRGDCPFIKQGGA